MVYLKKLRRLKLIENFWKYQVNMQKKLFKDDKDILE